MNKDRSISLMGVDLKFPFPLRTFRKLPSVVACDYDPVHQIFNFIHKSCPDFSKDVDMETFNWHKKVKGSIIVDKTGKDEKDKTQKDKWVENGSVHFMLDLATYQIQKIDETRTLLTQIHLFDAGGWTTPKLQHGVIKDRGQKLKKKTCLEHIKK